MENEIIKSEAISKLKKVNIPGSECSVLNAKDFSLRMFSVFDVGYHHQHIARIDVLISDNQWHIELREENDKNHLISALENLIKEIKDLKSTTDV